MTYGGYFFFVIMFYTKGSDIVIRGTTAKFKFNIPYNYEEITWITITFWQPGNNGPSNERKLPIVKTKDHCQQSNGNEVCVELNSEETLRFSDKFKAYVQLRANANGNTFASKQETITVYPIYGDDESNLEDPDLPAADDDGLIILDGYTIS